jgi:nitrite reductase/ring-hydroxylating ferredoxin subunit
MRCTPPSLVIGTWSLVIRAGDAIPDMSWIAFMSDYVTVAKVGAIPVGQGGTFAVGERLVAVFNRAGTYHAIDDICPHMGASLGAGYMDEEGVVTCPWHAWHFSVCDGTWCDNPRIKIDAFDVRVVGDEIQVRATPRGKE